MPSKGFAASMNHCISLSCSSRDSVEGWNSLSTQRSAAAMSAHDAPGDSRANAATGPNKSLLIESPPLLQNAGNRPVFASKASQPPEHARCVNERKAETSPQAWADQPEPCEIDAGAAEQRDDQAVAARRVEPQNAAPRPAAGRGPFPDRHGGQRQQDAGEERRGLPGPGHPGQVEDGMLHHTLPRAKPLAM